MVCRRGREDFGWFDVLDDAIDHTIASASGHLPNRVLVHHLDGQVQSVARLTESVPLDSLRHWG